MAKIILFPKKNFGNGSLTITDSDPNLSGTGLDDDVSSVIVISGTWKLWNKKDYGGNYWTVSDSGGPNHDGCYPDPSDWGTNANNKISSVQLT